MKTTKRLLVWALTMMIIASLVGCGASTTTSTSSSGSTLKKEISLPQGWEMKDAISAEEVGAIVGETMTYFAQLDSNAQNGKPSCAYNVPGKEFSKIYFRAYVNGGSEQFERTKNYAVKDSLKEVSGLGDKAYICDSTDETVIVVQKGETVVKVSWQPKFYSKFDKEELSKKLAGKLLENMYK